MKDSASPVALTQSEHLSLDSAQRVISAVHRASGQRGIRTAAAVVDAGGNVIAVARMDGAQLGSVSLAIDKAYTAIAFGHPTSRWSRSSEPGGTDWGLGTALGGRAVVIPGGVPIYHQGRLIGGLGVSGAAADADEACASEALAQMGLEQS